MNKLHTLRFAAVSVALASSLAGVASAETFRNGQSIYGQPGGEAAQARVVDVTNTKYANITYGETVVFQGAGGQKFAWTFNGLDARSWELAKFAPASLAGEGYRVYVSKNPLYRR
ncbi:CzcE family metal-binding protein [Hydrogenophaga crocea]|uniref:CzcE family metal-binding protein n=1 Tax=Hydrogenophaga crocea TaxID=2716225 RepID=A0A6G8IJ41_9BURK|nr:CzcE family metal-binding protein [Hydrogenophaga crocea]QIM53129.1 CzcE family metal-binding protein [Hydrogenophaga crocea]